MNDKYSGGLNDDKFALLYNANTSVKVAVKRPVGKTDSGCISNSQSYKEMSFADFVQ